MIDVSKHSPAAVLAALYNAARPFGMGFLHFTPGDMTEDEAKAIIGDRQRIYIDYLKGRSIKVDIGDASIDPSLFDRDYGHGAAADAISRIASRAA